jgi:hypothetical protein
MLTRRLRNRIWVRTLRSQPDSVRRSKNENYYSSARGTPMYRVEQEEPSTDFKQAWGAAGRHIQSQADTGLSWLRKNLNRPMAEHLSFRIGNQIFFVFVEAVEFKFEVGEQLFSKVINLAGAVPCLMPMEKRLGEWRPKHGGWGLIDINTGKVINPLDYVTDQLIEMSDWELHDFAIQIVCSSLEKQGKKIFAKQPSMEIDPSIWFEDGAGDHYVIVRAGRHPSAVVPLPEDTPEIKRACLGMSSSGYFASVIVANSQDPFDPNAKSNGNFLPLYRGHGMRVKFTGLLAL